MTHFACAMSSSYTLPAKPRVTTSPVCLLGQDGERWAVGVYSGAGRPVNIIQSFGQ